MEEKVRAIVPDRREQLPPTLPAPYTMDGEHVPLPSLNGTQIRPQGRPGKMDNAAVIDYSAGSPEGVAALDGIIIPAISAAAGFDPDEKITFSAKDPGGQTITNELSGRGEVLRWAMVELMKNVHDHVLAGDKSRTVRVYYGNATTASGQKCVFVSSKDDGPGLPWTQIADAKTPVLEGSEIRGVFWSFLRDLAAKHKGIKVEADSAGRKMSIDNSGTKSDKGTVAKGSEITVLIMANQQ